MYADAVASKAVRQLTPAYVAWEKEGQRVIGAYVTHTTVQSRLGGGEYNHYVFDTDDGLVKIALGRTTDGVLADQLQRGVVYAITYQGKERIAGGRSVNRFQIEEVGTADELPGEEPERAAAGEAAAEGKSATRKR